MGGWWSHSGEDDKGGYEGPLIDRERRSSDGNDGQAAIQNNQDYNNDRNTHGGKGGKGGYGGVFVKSGHDGEDGSPDGRGGKGGKPAISDDQNANGQDDNVNSASMFSRFWNLLSFAKQQSREDDRNREITWKENEESHIIRNVHDGTGGKGGKGGYGGVFVKSGHDGEDGSPDGRGGKGGKPTISDDQNANGQDDNVNSVSMLSRIWNFISPTKQQRGENDRNREITRKENEEGHIIGNVHDNTGGKGGKGGYGGVFVKSGHDGEDGSSDGRGGKGGKPAVS